MQYPNQPNRAPQNDAPEQKKSIMDRLRDGAKIVREKAAEKKQARDNGMPRQKRKKLVIPSYLKPLILFLRGLSILLISAAIVSCSLYFGVRMLYKKYVAPVDLKDDSTIVFIVESGDSLSEIATNLHDQNLVRNRSVFKYYVDFTDRTKNLKAGVYHLNRTMTLDQIIDIISLGSELDNTMMITIREGSTIEQMAEQIKEQMAEQLIEFDTDEFLALCNDAAVFSADYPFLAPLLEDSENQNRRYALEGYLFPDTYEIYLSASPEDVICKLLDRTDDILSKPEVAGALAESGMSIDDMLTLASVVEKEGSTDSFNKIAAIFLNRLDQNMKLQSDVTVQYALGISNLALNSGEINVDSPYNTYKYTGLPLGPICNPGINAIMGVLQPDQTYRSGNYLFFTLTDPNTGELAYSQTAEQHEQIVQQWRPVWEEYDAQNQN